MKIVTSRFSYEIPADKYVGVGIAVGKPKWELPYECEHLNTLAPYGIFQKYTGEEYKKHYFSRLDKIGTEKIREQLAEISKRHGNKDVALLCWENLNKGLTCHRRYFAEWWQEKTGEEIEELEGQNKQYEQYSLL